MKRPGLGDYLRRNAAEKTKSGLGLEVSEFLTIELPKNYAGAVQMVLAHKTDDYNPEKNAAVLAKYLESLPLDTVDELVKILKKKEP